MTPMSVAANGHPTPMASPRKPVTSVSKQNSVDQWTNVTATDGRRHLPPMTIDPFDAVRFFLDDWIEYAGETLTSHEELWAAYDDFRGQQQSIPRLSPKKFSQMLAANGCKRLVEDRRRRNGDGKRIVFYEVKIQKRLARRAAA
jgi:hypothetical protein